MSTTASTIQVRTCGNSWIGAATVHIGDYVTLLEEDGALSSYILTDARCVDAVERRVRGWCQVVATRDPLGQALLNARQGEGRYYDDDGRRAVRILAVQEGPDLRGWRQ